MAYKKTYKLKFKKLALVFGTLKDNNKKTIFDTRMCILNSVVYIL